ncbi:MAG: CHC2 zinc finger domain-containing protein [Phycisphaerales bacterium]
MLAATDLVALVGEHVALRQKGREWVGLCPFHDDRTPSLAVVVHKGDGFYKCFACGAAGNAIDFAMEHLRMDFPAALRFLAQRAGVALSPSPTRRSGEIDREALLRANAERYAHWRGLLVAAHAGRSRNPAAIAAARILVERRIDDAMIEQFQLGVASEGWSDLVDLVRARELDEKAFIAAGLLKPRQRHDGDGTIDEARPATTGGRGASGCYDAFRNRIVFPICDEAGRAIAFGARKIDPADEPKYLNSSESAAFSKSRTLYGLHLAKRAIIDAGCAVVTEGYTDVIACHQAGFRNVVATLGTALTIEHARTLRRLCERVVLLFDGDEAGQKAADRAAEVFFAEPVDVLVCVIPDHRDPDELLKLHDGPDRFRAALDGAQPVLDFLVDRFMATYRTATTMSGRQQRLEAFLARLAELGLGRAKDLRRRFVLQRLAALVGVPIHDLESSMPEARARRAPLRDLAAKDATRDPSPGGHPSDAHSGATGASSESSGDATPAPGATPLAIIRAEEAVLGLLVAHPEIANETVDAGDGHWLPVTEAMSAATFLHPPHRDLADVLVPLLEDAAGVAGALPMRSLLAELAQPSRRVLASTLYFAAEARLAARNESPATMLKHVCADLDAARRRLGLPYGESVRDDAVRAASAPPARVSSALATTPAMAASTASSTDPPIAEASTGSPHDERPDATVPQGATGAVDAAAQLLERLRRRGPDPSAIARFARRA